jgi:hypothetical protein
MTLAIHWIPTHRGRIGNRSDKEVFEAMRPRFVKIICIDDSVPYLEDMPASVETIIVRNHPMSELYENRGLRSLLTDQLVIDVMEDGALIADAPPDIIEDAYRAYFGGETGMMAREARGVALGVIASASEVGRQHAETCNKMALYCESKGVSRERLAFEGLNEPMLWSTESPEAVATYYAAFLDGLHSFNLRGVVGNFGVGWPGNGGVTDAPVQWDFFKPVFDRMFTTPKRPDYLGLHEYWNLSGAGENWGWWAGRFTQCKAKVAILITETGIDCGVAGHSQHGWDTLPGNSLRERAVRYVGDLAWYWQKCLQDPRVQGVFTFTYDRGSDTWIGFDLRFNDWIDEYTARLAEFPSAKTYEAGSTPVTPPPPVIPPPVIATTAIIGSVASTLPNDGTTYVYGRALMANAKVMFAWRDNPAIAEIPVGPHEGYPGWQPGYFNIPLYVEGKTPCVGKWDVWCTDGVLTSERVHFDTDGKGGMSNQIEVNFDLVSLPEPASATLADALRNEFGAAFSDIHADLAHHATLKYATRSLDKIQQYALHHAATPLTTTWKSVADYHVNTRGWPGIGYCLGIRQTTSGYTVSLLNMPETVSYHCGTTATPGDENLSALGICVIGNFETDTVPDELWSTVQRAIKVTDGFLGRKLLLVGHRDIDKTTVCPGKNLYARLLAPTAPPALLLPEHEPADMTLKELMQKLFWWIEKYTRCIETGNAEYDPEYGSAILYSLMKSNSGLLYRLRNALNGGMARG